MEFINYVRKDASSQGTASTNIKNVKTLLGLYLNLEAGKKETTFSGLGSYLEVIIKHKGTSNNVKIPFFCAYGKDKFINKNGYNYVNPLAKKIIKKVVKNNNPIFDLVAFKADAQAEIDACINALGTAPEVLARISLLEDRRDNIIATAVKKDSEKLVREEIEYLKDLIEQGLNLQPYTNDASRKTAILNYYNHLERLVTLEHQLKKMTWSQKQGLSKLNNKHLKRAGAVVAAAVVAASLAIVRVFEFPKHVFDTVESWFKKPTTTTVQTVNQTPTSTIIRVTPAPVHTTQPQAPAARVETTYRDNGYTINSEMFIGARNANYNKFEGLKSLIGATDDIYNSLIIGYTFVEHINQMDISSIDENKLNDYIIASRILISAQFASEHYEDFQITHEVRNAIGSGSINEITAFMQSACENKEPLLKVLAVGEFTTKLYFEDALLSFNNNFYLPEIEEYKTEIMNGNFKSMSSGSAKVRSLGTYYKI